MWPPAGVANTLANPGSQNRRFEQPSHLSSGQHIVPNVDRLPLAGSIHGHGRFRNSTTRDSVVADLSILRATNEDGAVRGFSVKLAGAERASANECLADDVVDDPDTISVTDEDRVDERISDPVSLDRNVPILEVILKSLRTLRQ
jgi:hypothetical protein